MRAAAVATMATRAVTTTTSMSPIRELRPLISTPSVCRRGATDGGYGGGTRQATLLASQASSNAARARASSSAAGTAQSESGYAVPNVPSSEKISMS